MEIKDLKKAFKEDGFSEDTISRINKQFNTYLNLMEIVTKKEFTKNLPLAIKQASPVFDEIILNIFSTIRKSFNDIYNI